MRLEIKHMNPINENNLTEQSLIDWLKSQELASYNIALLIIL